MGTRSKHRGDGESRPSNQLIKEWRWTGISAHELYPASTLTAQWLADANISHEKIAQTGLYYPVYEEDTVNGNTRTKTATENSDGEGNSSTGDTSEVLLESESRGGDA